MTKPTKPTPTKPTPTTPTSAAPLMAEELEARRRARVAARREQEERAASRPGTMPVAPTDLDRDVAALVPLELILRGVASARGTSDPLRKRSAMCAALFVRWLPQGVYRALEERAVEATRS